MIQTSIQNTDAITTIQVLAAIGMLLEIILVGLMTWVLKTTLENKIKLTTIYSVLFGVEGKGGLVADFASFKKDEETLRRTLQRCVIRLGNIEDRLKIPRNIGDRRDDKEIEIDGIDDNDLDIEKE